MVCIGSPPLTLQEGPGLIASGLFCVVDFALPLKVYTEPYKSPPYSILNNVKAY